MDTLHKLKEGKHVEIPVYDFTTHARAKYTVSCSTVNSVCTLVTFQLYDQHTMYGANVVVFEGILAFCHTRLLELMDLKIFVDTDSDIRLARRYLTFLSITLSLPLSPYYRLRRDISERGRDLEGVLKQYNKFVKPVRPNNLFSHSI